MKYIKGLSAEEFSKIRSYIKNSKNEDLISTFTNAPCYKATWLGHRNMTWHEAPETVAFGSSTTKSLWRVNANKNRVSLWKYRQNIYILVDFGSTLYRWRFTEDFAKKIKLI